MRPGRRERVIAVLEQYGLCHLFPYRRHDPCDTHRWTELDCGGFHALTSGVVLTKDKTRKTVLGFVPMAALRYVVPDDFEPVGSGAVAETVTDRGSTEESAPLEITGPRGGETASGSDLVRLGSPGPTYASRPVAAGYESMVDLIEADPGTVAATAAIPEGLPRRWLPAARA